MLERVGVNWTRAGFLRILERMGAIVLADLEAAGDVHSRRAGRGHRRAQRADRGDDGARPRRCRWRSTSCRWWRCSAASPRATRSCGAPASCGSRSRTGSPPSSTGCAASARDRGAARRVRRHGDGRAARRPARAHGDHRLALLGAVAGLASEEGVEVVGMDAAGGLVPAVCRRCREADRVTVVAIDGPAGAGKSTVARAVADGLGFTYLDTGRDVPVRWRWPPMERGGRARLESPASLKIEPGERILLDGRDVTEEIRTPAVSEAASTGGGGPRRCGGAVAAEQRRLLSRGRLGRRGARHRDRRRARRRGQGVPDRRPGGARAPAGRRARRRRGDGARRADDPRRARQHARALAARAGGRRRGDRHDPHDAATRSSTRSPRCARDAGRRHGAR